MDAEATVAQIAAKVERGTTAPKPAKMPRKPRSVTLDAAGQDAYDRLIAFQSMLDAYEQRLREASGRDLPLLALRAARAGATRQQIATAIGRSVARADQLLLEAKRLTGVSDSARQDPRRGAGLPDWWTEGTFPPDGYDPVTAAP